LFLRAEHFISCLPQHLEAPLQPSLFLHVLHLDLSRGLRPKAVKFFELRRLLKGIPRSLKPCPPGLYCFLRRAALLINLGR
jgi:hypothetical protein